MTDDELTEKVARIERALGLLLDGKLHAAQDFWANTAPAVREAVEHDDLRAEVARLKSLLGRYADHVGDQEGTDFLNHAGYGGHYQITPEEAAEIASYCPSAALQEADR